MAVLNGDTSNSGFWLFGYGSLIWKPPPHFDRRIPGYVTGYVRRFWQASEDHRGTSLAPGRVVTLIERAFWESLGEHQRSDENDRVWGAAYHIVPDKVNEVQEYLDIREINGYSIQYTPFHPADPSIDDIRCMVYIGMPDNPQFLGRVEPEEVAKTINKSVGPSGPNREYLLQLEASLLNLGAESGDAHVADLARRIRAMKPPWQEDEPADQELTSLQKISTDEQAVEKIDLKG